MSPAPTFPPLPLFTLFYYARNKSFICLSRSSLRKTINHSPCFTMSSRTTQKTLARADWGSGSDNKNVSFSHTKQITCRQSEVSLCRLCKETSPRFPPPPSPPPLTPLLSPSCPRTPFRLPSSIRWQIVSIMCPAVRMPRSWNSVAWLDSLDSRLLGPAKVQPCRIHRNSIHASSKQPQLIPRRQMRPRVHSRA